MIKSDYTLSDNHPDDFIDVVIEVEDSLNISFGDTELQHVSTFGEFSDLVILKLNSNFESANDCTSQQAFHRIRNAISKTLTIDRKELVPSTRLENLFPKKNRRVQIKKMESLLGFPTKALKPSDILIGFGCISILTSLIWLFFSWKIGMTILISSILFMNFIYWQGKMLRIHTIGELAEKIARENYFKSRRQKNTFNPNEIENLLKDIFVEKLGTTKETISKESLFVERS